MITIKAKTGLEKQHNCRTCHGLYTYVLPGLAALAIQFVARESIKFAQYAFTLDLADMGRDMPDVYVM